MKPTIKLILPFILLLLFSGIAIADEGITNSIWVTDEFPDLNLDPDGNNLIQPNDDAIIFMELPNNYSTTILSLYAMGGQSEADVQIYNTLLFDETTITYNSRPANSTLVATFHINNSFANSWFNVTLPNPNKYIMFVTGDAGSVTLASDDAAAEFRPYINEALTNTVTISCPAAGWCYAASNYSSKTLLELDNLFSTDTIQGHYNSTSQKYESHRTGYTFNQNVNVEQKEGYYYYFSSAQDITTTPGSTPSITLRTGWNLVGNYGTSARTLSALKTSIGASATQAKYYDKTLKTWVSTDSQSVPAMESFFVYVTSQTEWGD